VTVAALTAGVVAWRGQGAQLAATKARAVQAETALKATQVALTSREKTRVVTQDTLTKARNGAEKAFEYAPMWGSTPIPTEVLDALSE
jgi:hypothetical protein